MARSKATPQSQLHPSQLLLDFGHTEGTSKPVYATGNRGEWSEIYALAKLLGTQAITVPQVQGTALTYPITEVHIERPGRALEYHFRQDGNITFCEYNGAHQCVQEKVISVDGIRNLSPSLLQRIGKGKRAFSCAAGEALLSLLGCETMKAPSNVKADIWVVIQTLANQKQRLGFSLKSELGSAPTLFNASRASTMIYPIQGKHPAALTTLVEQLKTQQILPSEPIRSQLEMIQQYDCFLGSGRPEVATFYANLVTVDTAFAQIWGDAVLAYYTQGAHTFPQIAAHLATDTFSSAYYEQRFRAFLEAVATSLVAGKLWDGRATMLGGYLIILKSGALSCHPFGDHEAFRDYLIEHSWIGQPSRIRGHFGAIYTEGNEVYMKLNAQIRFK